MIDAPEIIDEIKDVPYHPSEAFRAWEKLRWIFNLAVGLVGLLGAVALQFEFNLLYFIGAAIYGFIANVFYNLGLCVEMDDQHFLKGELGLCRRRSALFILGTGASMGLTFLILQFQAVLSNAPF